MMEKPNNAIDIGDIRKLYEHKRVFNIHTPYGLLNKVWFKLLLYFCRRGQENLREMKPCHFEVAFDGEGKQFVHRVSSEVTKSQQGDVNEHYEPAGGRMYAIGTELCPVASFVKYVSKLNPKCEALWKRPRNSCDDNDKYWYEDKPLGKNTLAVMMSNISKKGNLSQEYTNHCVRATCITVLSESGFEARHIVTLSGHRNEQSIQNYVRDTSTAQKQKMSASISLFTAAAQIPLVTNSNQEKESSTNVIDNDLNESDLDLNSEYDNIIASIYRGEKELQPLSDITNVPLLLPQRKENDSKAPVVFSNCQVTIHNFISS